MWTLVQNARTKKLLLLGALGGAALLLYLRFARPTEPMRTEPGPVTVAAPPRSVERIIEKVKVVVTPGPERIVYLDKPQIAAVLKMPELNQIADNVTSVASVPPSDGTTTAVGILSPTGESRILLRQEPPKFFEVKKQFQLEGRYLFTGRNLAEVDLVANPARIGPVNILAGAGVEVRRDDSSIGARAWVGFQYRF